MTNEAKTMTLREQAWRYVKKYNGDYNSWLAGYSAGAEAQRERDADLANLFRALINALDYLRAARDGHVHSADGSANCIGCCIVAEGEHAANSYKAKLRTPATSPGGEPDWQVLAQLRTLQAENADLRRQLAKAREALRLEAAARKLAEKHSAEVFQDNKRLVTAVKRQSSKEPK